MFLQDFFEALTLSEATKQNIDEKWSEVLHIYEKSEKNFPEIKKGSIVMFSCPEYRGEELEDIGRDLSQVRDILYSLFPHEFDKPIYDLGNLRLGASKNDSYVAIEEIFRYLLSQNCNILFLGGSQDLSYAISRAYSGLKQFINIGVIDQGLDLGDPEGEVDNKGFMAQTVTQNPNIVFNYINLGSQNYLNNPFAISLMNRLDFDIYRLGNLKGKIEEAESPIRDCDFVSFDMSAIRRSDSPGNAYSFPTGFSAEEACQMSQYAGLSCQTSCFGIFDYHSALDKENISATIIAQMLWCFLYGLEHRVNDHPLNSSDFEFTKYNVVNENGETEFIFLKCTQTDHWWMCLPVSDEQKLYYGRHIYIPCRYEDYKYCLENGKGDIWWRHYRRLK